MAGMPDVMAAVIAVYHCKVCRHNNQCCQCCICFCCCRGGCRGDGLDALDLLYLASSFPGRPNCAAVSHMQATIVSTVDARSNQVKLRVLQHPSTQHARSGNSSCTTRTPAKNQLAPLQVGKHYTPLGDEEARQETGSGCSGSP
eukprot:GHRR01034060.1.p2 GENE.GHRR01034060.1~~GHRR01034060.1.p2  ORF type:complete len:144 (-),score=40.22 GHRR01034060.1:517-948(-)